ncbi:MAG: hypothetical protein K6A23_12070, partial [Butyrivibrio sp.]|nr:hypothetical protein [Butyrivibrio sp.]
IAKWTYSGWLCMWIVLFIACLIIWIPKRNAAEIASMIRISKPVAIATAVIFVWCVLSLSGVSTYIYLGF